MLEMNLQVSVCIWMRAPCQPAGASLVGEGAHQWPQLLTGDTASAVLPFCPGGAVGPDRREPWSQWSCTGSYKAASAPSFLSASCPRSASAEPSSSPNPRAVGRVPVSVCDARRVTRSASQDGWARAAGSQVDWAWPGAEGRRVAESVTLL